MSAIIKTSSDVAYKDKNPLIQLGGWKEVIDIDIDVSRHIDELISEWEQCREDERSAQNQQVQVIATAGAILGGVYTVAAIILKGADQSTIRALFYISSITLLVAVAYIVTIGISNVLRYHYMRDLEDRLYQLIPHEPEDMLFTHWMSFCSPITTRNPLHITTSIYTVIHYCCYAVAALGGVAFCIMMIILQYDFVPEHNVWDRIVFQSTLLFMPIALGIFIWISVKAEKMYALSAKKAAEKRYSRFSVQQIQVFKAGTQKHIWSIFSYFFYPKKKDFQKGLLIAAGFAAGAGVSGGNRELSRVLQDGFFCWILLDFLIYQARYLWNDIRGASEDMVAGKTGRLPVRELGLGKAATIATAVIVLRLVLALVLIHRLEQELQEVFFFSFCVIAVISIVYEIARTKEWDKAVFLFVSLGYPIRIFSGFWAACPGMWKEPFFAAGEKSRFRLSFYYSLYICAWERFLPFCLGPMKRSYRRRTERVF